MGEAAGVAVSKAVSWIAHATIRGQSVDDSDTRNSERQETCISIV